MNLWVFLRVNIGKLFEILENVLRVVDIWNNIKFIFILVLNFTVSSFEIIIKERLLKFFEEFFMGRLYEGFFWNIWIAKYFWSDKIFLGNFEWTIPFWLENFIDGCIGKIGVLLFGLKYFKVCDSSIQIWWPFNSKY